MPKMKKQFTKPPLSYAAQLDLLESRGMAFADRTQAEFILSHVNYYRLGAYWLTFESDHASHKFEDGTTFERVLELYTFDRELRLLLLNCIEHIEVSVRTKWAYAMAHSHGSHSHMDSTFGVSAEWTLQNTNKLREELGRSSETFVSHFRDNYAEDSPPVWAACEVVSLGLLSRLYRNLNPMSTRKSISQCYEIDESVLQSWLHHLSIVRNVCAHHSRLWNREFAVTPKRPRKPLAISEAFTNSRRLYNTLLVLLHFMDIISPAHKLREQFNELVEKYSISLKLLGFPEDWQAQTIWLFRSSVSTKL